MTLTMKHVIFAAVLCMACAAEAEGEDFELVSNRYDHLGRRVQKITPEATHTYFYDGWLLVKEVVERSGDTRRCGVSPRHCGGAGGVGGLLYVKINGAIYVPWYDAYGNVMGYWDAEGHVVAEYTYDFDGSTEDGLQNWGLSTKGVQ